MKPQVLGWGRGEHGMNETLMDMKATCGRWWNQKMEGAQSLPGGDLLFATLHEQEVNIYCAWVIIHIWVCVSQQLKAGYTLTIRLIRVKSQQELITHQWQHEELPEPTPVLSLLNTLCSWPSDHLTKVNIRKETQNVSLTQSLRWVPTGKVKGSSEPWCGVK